MLAGTDNDYSVTQNASSVQFAVYFKPVAGPLSRIRCDIGTFSNRIKINANGSAVPAGFDFSGYRLIPGVLHAYKASAADAGRSEGCDHGHNKHDHHPCR